MPNKEVVPFVFIIFGASGDLAKLKIFPALYSLQKQGFLPKEFHIIGYARTEKSKQEFRKDFLDSISTVTAKGEQALVKALTERTHYVVGEYDNHHDFDRLRRLVADITQGKPYTQIAYLSVPPVAYKDIIYQLAQTTPEDKQHLRVVIEKPFGIDEKSATALYHYTAGFFTDEHIYHLDHYLGKTSVQSILHLRHANFILSNMMKGSSIANIQITAFEDFGIKNRVGYFDQVGTLKDMVQSHLLQILALSTMSIPITDSAESLHREKYAILSALTFDPKPQHVVRGQYASYRDAPQVPKDSDTETSIALKLGIDRENWHSIPIYLRTGKNLDRRLTSVVVELKKFPYQEADEEPNRLVFELQPQARLMIGLINKHGSTTEYERVTTIDTIGCEGEVCLPEHALLLLDVLSGNKKLFISFPEIITSWHLIDQITSFIARHKIPLQHYPDHSKGPSGQYDLTALDNFKWFELN